MSRSSICFRSLALIALFFTVSPFAAAAAANKEFKGDAGGNGNASQNDKFVDPTTGLPVATGPGANDVVKIGQGKKVTLDLSPTWGAIDFTGGTIDTAGSFNLTLALGTSIWNGGEIIGATVNSTVGMTIGGGGTAPKKVSNSGKLALGGSTTWSAENLGVAGGSEIVNSGSFTTTFDGTITHDGGARGTFKNEGTFVKSAGTAAGTEIQASFQNTAAGASVQVDAGALKLSGGGNSNKNVSLASGSKLQISGNDFEFSGGALNGAGTGASKGVIEIGSFVTTFGNTTGTADLTVNGTGTARINGSHATSGKLRLSSGKVDGTTNTSTATVSGFEWTGGEVSNAVINSSGTTIGAGGAKTLGASGKLTLSGDTSWDGSSISTTAGAKIENTSGKIFTATTGSILHDGGATRAVFTNAGIFNKSSGTGTTDIQTVFDSTGSMNVAANTGMLKLSGGGISSGAGNSVSIGSNGKVQADSNYTFDGTAFSGDGTVEILSATTTFKGAGGSPKVAIVAGSADFNTSLTTVSSLSLASGAITSSGAAGAVDTGAFDWTGGSVNGKVKSTGNAGASGAAAKTIGSTGELTLAGSTANTWTGGAVTNQGKLSQTAGTTDIQTSLANAGQVAIAANGGTLKLSGGGISSGAGNSVSIGTNGKVQSASNYTFDGTSITGDGTVEIISATTTFKGAGGSAKVSLNGGSADFNTSLTTVSSLALTSGAITSSGVAGAVDTGAFDWTGGSVNGKVKSTGNAGASGAAVKTIGASGELTLAGSTANAWTGGAVTNQGKLSQTAGTTDIQTSLANAGQVAIAANGGTLKLSGGGSSSGAGNSVTIGTNGKVQAASNYTFDGTAFSGDGTVEIMSATTTFKGAGGSAKVALNGGSADFNTSLTTVSSLSLASGAITSSGVAGAVDTGAFDWTGGSVNGKVKSTGNAGASGAAAKTIGSTGELTLAGSTANAWTGGAVTNQGKLSQTAGTTDIQTSLANAGQVAIAANGGTLKLSGGGSSSGAGNSVTIGTNGKVQAASNYTFDGTAFSGDGTVEIMSATTTFKGAGGSAKIAIAGGTADFNTSQSTTGALELSSGLVTSSSGGSAEVTSLAWTGGTINGKVKAAAGTFGGGAKSITGGELTLTGTTAWDGSTLTASNAALLKTETGATFNATGDGMIATTNGATFSNAGTFAKSGGTATTEIQTVFDSTGTVSVAANKGALKLSGGGKTSGNVSLGTDTKLEVTSNNYLFENTTHTGTGTVELKGAMTTFKNATGAQKIAVSGGNATFDTSLSTAANLAISAGTVASANNGSANVTNLDWTGGTINGKVKSLGATLGGGAKSITGGELTLAGTTAWDGSTLTASNAALLKTESGATFNATGDGMIATTNGATFSNAGTFTKSGGTATTEIQTVFDSTGTVSVAANKGALKLSGGGKTSGNVSLGTDTKLEVTSNNYLFENTTHTGTGTVELKGATTTFKNATGAQKIAVSGGNATFDTSLSTAANLAISSGTVTSANNGSADVTNLDWTGGTINGKVKAAAGTFGGGAKSITGGELTLTGTTAWDGSTLNASNAALLKTESGATFSATGDGMIATTNGATFSNAGTFTKSGGTATTEIQTVFDSTGTVSVAANKGALKLSGGGKTSGNVSLGTDTKLEVTSNNYVFENTTHTGTGTVELKGATTTFKNATGAQKIAVSGGNATFDTSLSTAANLAISSGTVASANNGSANVTNLDWTGGTINGKVKSLGATLGGGAKSITGGELTLAGTTAWDGSTLTASNAALLKTETGATFNATGDGMIATTNGATFTNAGTFTKSGGTATTEIQTTFDSTGTVSVAANKGALKLSGGGKTSGNVSLGTDTKLEVTSNNYLFENTTHSGTGTVELKGATTTFKNATGAQKIAVSGGNATFDTSLSTAANLAISSGTVASANNGSADVTNLDWTAGTLTGKVKAANGTLGTGAKSISGGELTLTGATSWDGSSFTANNAGKLKNEATGTFSVTNDGMIATTNGATFTNAGTFAKSGGTATTEIQTTFDSTGTINISDNKGALKLSGGGKSSGQVTLGAATKLEIATNSYTFENTTHAGAGTIELSSSTTTFKNVGGNGKFAVTGGTATFDGAVSTAGSLSLSSGTITSANNGSADLGSIAWTGGTINGKVKAGGGTLGGGAKNLVGGELTLTGATAWDGTSIQASNSGKLKNDTSGVFNVNADGTIAQSNGGAFENAGNFNKSGGTGTTEIQTTFDSTGSVAVAANKGTLKLTGGGKSSNNVNVGANAKVQIENTAYTFENAALNGDGAVDLVSSVTTFKGTSGNAKVVVNGGTARIDGGHNGNGKLHLASGKVDSIGASSATFGTLEWTGGEIHATTVIASGATIGNGSAKNLTAGAKLKLSGASTWDGSDLNTQDGAEITNDGTFTTGANGKIGHVANGRGTFKNNGTFEKSGAGTETLIETIFENSATVNVASGKLKLAGGARNKAGGGIAVAALAQLDIDGDLTLEALSELKGNGLARLLAGTFDATGTITIKEFEFEGGQLNGSQTFKDKVTWKGGNWNSAGTTTIDGELNLEQTNGHEFNFRHVVNNGVVNWKAGNIRGGKGSEFLNAQNASFVDKNAGAKTLEAPGASNGTFTFTNNGTYRKEGTGTTIVQVPFTNNNGTVNITAGTIRFTDTFTQSAGTLSIGAGTTAQFDQGLNFGAGTLTGGGTVVGNVTTSGLFSPGSSPGTFNITGDLTLGALGTTRIEIAGGSKGVTYDFVAVSGAAVLGGTLEITFTNNFHTTVTPTDTFTVLTSSGAGGLTGLFGNVTNGQRLFTLDGAGSFQVNYGLNSALGASLMNSVVLSDFAAVPEPSTWALMIAGLGILAVLSRRRR